jgi:hypothetical protein
MRFRDAARAARDALLRPSQPDVTDDQIRKHLAAHNELPDATDREWFRLERGTARGRHRKQKRGDN